MSESLYDIWVNPIKRTASFIARDFPDVEAEDLEQDLWVFVLERDWETPEDKNMMLILRRYARSKAMEYLVQHRTTSVQYSYQTSEVRRILEQVFEYDNWPRRSVPGYRADNGNDVPQWGLFDNTDDFTREGVPAPEGQFNRSHRLQGAEDGDPFKLNGHGRNLVNGVSCPSIDWDDRITGFVDIKAAWERLPNQYQRAIFQKFALGWEPENENERRRLNRAVIRLTDTLNWY